MTDHSKLQRHYNLTPALSLSFLHDQAEPDFEDSAKAFMQAYFRFLHELTDITYHGQLLPEDEKRLRDLFEKMLRSRTHLG